jgi:hypothetical protein
LRLLIPMRPTVCMALDLIKLVTLSLNL